MEKTHMPDMMDIVQIKHEVLKTTAKHARYTFPQQWMKKLYVKNLRIFASVQNPLTFTKMKGGWDPEYTGDGSGRSYPVARVYSFGLNVKF